MFNKMNPSAGKTKMKGSKLIQHSSSRGWSRLGLALAKVVAVFAQEMKVTLQVITGQQETPIYEGVELTLPGQGARHFLGALPDVGDVCVVGWFVSNSDGQASSKTPAILSWLPRASYLGQEWIPYQPYSAEEGVLNNQNERDAVEGVAQRVRNRMRNYESGNIGMASSQGSDILLDESVSLSNRRANEIKLRDQDQALVMRSIQQFHAMGGARIYGGQVQRDARLLPTELFSDGTDWNARVQMDEVMSFLGQYDLPASDTPDGVLLHQEVFHPTNGMVATESDAQIDSSLNPYRFLYDAGLIDLGGGDLTDSRKEVYGGKSVLRIDPQGDNAFSGGTNALTEYRIELSHVHDGTLPVTEQTDGFDADRIPLKGADPSTYIEWVLGSVVGNNPHVSNGSLYGVPLVPKLPEGTLVGGLDVNLGEHMATLLKLVPVSPSEDSPTWMGLNKAGAYKAYIGNTESNAVDIRVAGGMNISAGGRININSDVEVVLTGGFNMVAESKPLKIYAGGTNRTSDNTEAEFNPSLELGGKESVTISAEQGILMEAPKVAIKNASVYSLEVSENATVSAGESIFMRSKKLVQAVNGKHEVVYTGPADFLPINAPIRKTQFLANPATGHVGGPTDVYEMLFGDKTETILVGNHLTAVGTGSITKTVGVGAIALTAPPNSLSITNASVTLTAGAGALALVSGVGATTITSATVIQQKALGAITLSAPLITLSSPGIAIGAILCGSDIDVVTGLPYQVINPTITKGQNLSNIPL